MISSEKKFFKSNNTAFKPEIITICALIHWLHRDHPEYATYGVFLIMLSYTLGHYILWLYNRRKARKIEAETLGRGS